MRASVGREDRLAQSTDSERCFHRLLNDDPDALLIVDEQGRVHYANPAALTLFHVSLEALHERRFEPPVSEKGLFAWTLFIEGEGAVTVEAKRSPIEWDGQAMQLLSLRDTRQRKRARNARHRRRAASRAFFHSKGISSRNWPIMPATTRSPACRIAPCSRIAWRRAVISHDETNVIWR